MMEYVRAVWHISASLMENIYYFDMLLVISTTVLRHSFVFVQETLLVCQLV